MWIMMSSCKIKCISVEVSNDVACIIADII
jgi:hypothetical protein